MNVVRFIVLAFCSLISRARSSQVEAEKKSCTMVVWADLSFDESKKLTGLEVLEKDARGHEEHVTDGFYAQSTSRWSKLSTIEFHWRL